MIEELLPVEVACAEAFDDPADVALFPEEEAAVAQAGDKRRREFATARACARLALKNIGLPPAPVVPGLRGAPQWPSGVVGSITHCIGYRACAVAHARNVATIGIDAEPNDALPRGVLATIARADELAWFSERSATTSPVCWDRLLFSAKESVYKAWFPLAKRGLNFEDAAVTVDPTSNTFTARLLVPGPMLAGRPLTAFTGRWMVRNALVVTAIAVPAQSLTNRDTKEQEDHSSHDVPFERV